MNLMSLMLLGTMMLSGDEAAMDKTTPASVNVEIVTSMGTFLVALDAEKAPVTVENFLAYVDAGFYDGTIFHRVIPNFMVQGGGFTPDMKKKDTRDGIQNEANNGRKNSRGTLAMARTNDPHSATGQFFINHRDNAALDHTGKNARGWGYAVFADVLEGMDIVDSIAGVRTGSLGQFRDVPRETVMIETIRRVE